MSKDETAETIILGGPLTTGKNPEFRSGEDIDDFWLRNLNGLIP